FFELNGQPREVLILDKELVKAGASGGPRKAEPGNALHVGAPMPGAVVTVAVADGEHGAGGPKLLTRGAMKMERTLDAARAGGLVEVSVRPGARVEGGALLLH